jgi:pSer/pThr/pTyr-binding forkhead associated (FHA) protein
MDGCHLQIAAPIQEVKTERVTICKATINAIAGRGSIIGECVCIDSEEIKTLPNQRYNIGIGKQPFMSDGTHRDNHIAIDDDQSSVEFDKNKYVSRAHAHISYSEEHGFMLQVEQGGTQLAQKRTHIYRGGEKIALNNTLIPEPLQDGDYIVLSKNVHLLYKKA